MNDRDMVRLRHLLEEADDILAFTREQTRDKKTMKAVMRSIEIMGEAARHVSAGCKAAYPEIPWQSITDMRNFIAHEYFRVDDALVWQVAVKEIPEIREKLVHILSSRRD